MVNLPPSTPFFFVFTVSEKETAVFFWGGGSWKFLIAVFIIINSIESNNNQCYPLLFWVVVRGRWCLRIFMKKKKFYYSWLMLLINLIKLPCDLWKNVFLFLLFFFFVHSFLFVNKYSRKKSSAKNKSTDQFLIVHKGF